MKQDFEDRPHSSNFTSHKTYTSDFVMLPIMPVLLALKFVMLPSFPKKSQFDVTLLDAKKSEILIMVNESFKL